MHSPLSDIIKTRLSSIDRIRVIQYKYNGLAEYSSPDSQDIFNMPIDANSLRILNFKVLIPGCSHFQLLLNGKNTTTLGIYSIAQYIKVDQFLYDTDLNAYCFNRDDPIRTKNIYAIIKNMTPDPTTQITIEMTFEDLD